MKRRNSAVRCGAVLFTTLLLISSQFQRSDAYTLILRSGDEPLHWPADAFPIRFRVHEGTGPQLANVTDDSDPLAAVTRALGHWPAASSVRMEAEDGTTADGGRDSRNVVTFADTEDNRELFEMAGEPVGLTLFFFNGDAEITEADVLFNPNKTFTTTVDSIEELESADRFDVEAVGTHEFGHSIGLDHSGVESAAMWPLASLVPRTLDPDDIAAARVLYPTGAAAGRIEGMVRVGGDGAFGAQVVAVSDSGPVISSLTLSDGSYVIENLAPGSYTAYVEPLDGPHSSQPGDPCSEFGNLSPSGPWGGKDLSTDFPTTFAEQSIEVRAGEAADVDFQLDKTANTLNPVLLGTASGGSFSLSAVPVEIAAGTRQKLAVAGAGVGDVAESGIRLAGDDVQVVEGSRSTESITCNRRNTPVLLFEVAVDAAAASGGRSIVLTTTAETAALTGGLRIRAVEQPSPTRTVTPTVTRTATPRPTSTPAPCVGDCNGDGEITIDELVRGVAIALGNSPLSACTDFDVNVDGVVTVDELVRAVNAALNGCV